MLPPFRHYAPFAVILFGSASALAGTVKGRMVGQDKLVPAVYTEGAKPEAHRYSWREPSPTVKAEYRVLAANPSRDICVVALSANNAPARDPVVVKITGGHTIPTTIVITPGTRLSFENRDPFAHRLYGVGIAGWAAETLNPGAHRDWTGPAGVNRYEFRDELTPSLRLYVVVEPQAVEVAYPNHDGAFAFTLPTGEFILKAYFEGREVGKPVRVVSKDKAALELKEPLFVGEGSK